MPEKPTKEIASNTGPLITIERLPNGFSLMKSLYRHIFIPPQVMSELLFGTQRYSDEEEYLAHHNISEFLVIENAPEPPSDIEYLETGEKYAISLALFEG